MSIVFLLNSKSNKKYKLNKTANQHQKEVSVKYYICYFYNNVKG